MVSLDLGLARGFAGDFGFAGAFALVVADLVGLGAALTGAVLAFLAAGAVKAVRVLALGGIFARFDVRSSKC